MRFPVGEACRVLVPAKDGLMMSAAAVNNLPLSGAFRFPYGGFDPEACRAGWLLVEITGVGRIAGKMRRIAAAPGRSKSSFRSRLSTTR